MTTRPDNDSLVSNRCMKPIEVRRNSFAPCGLLLGHAGEHRPVPPPQSVRQAIARAEAAEERAKAAERSNAELTALGIELLRATDRFPAFNSPHEGWAVIKEEMDELWEHVRGNTGRSQDAHKEAIQVAAMALRYALDLREGAARSAGRDSE